LSVAIPLGRTRHLRGCNHILVTLAERDEDLLRGKARAHEEGWESESMRLIDIEARELLSFDRFRLTDLPQTLVVVGPNGGDSVEDTWASRDLPVLEAIVGAFNDPDRFQLRIPELTGLCGLPEQNVITALRALGNTRPPLLEYPRPPEELTYPIIITDVTERARRLVDQWPTADSLAEQIAEALTEAAEHEPDPVKKRRLREAGAVLGDTARGVLVEVLSRIVERQAGLG
jgi:hypothetical protein